MSIWIELHCDKQAPASGDCGRNKCMSGSGNQPGSMTLRRPAETARQMIARAKKAGWLFDSEGMAICPECAKYWQSISNAALRGGEAVPLESTVMQRED